MASATARALELLELLESAGTRTVGELAGRLSLDERSVRRHIERLRELGIPIEAIRGRAGGYRIAPSYRLPPLMLSDGEAVAVLAALTVARGSANQLSASSTLATAIAKISRSLPLQLADRARALLDVVVGAERPRDEVDPSILLTAADAIRSLRPLAISYRTGERQSQRTLQPHDLIAYNGTWYLTGLDSLARANRTFRLDRIVSMRALAGAFPAPAAGDAVGDLVQGFARADYRYVVRLRVQASVEEIRRQFPPSVADLEELAVSGDDPPWFGVVIHAQALDWLPRNLLALGRPVVVEEPQELRGVLLEQSVQLARMASRPSSARARVETTTERARLARVTDDPSRLQHK